MKYFPEVFVRSALLAVGGELLAILPMGQPTARKYCIPTTPKSSSYKNPACESIFNSNHPPL